MVTDTPTKGSASGAGELLAHLRQHPEDLRRSASDLATTFGLTEAFVRTVLEGVQPPKSEKKRRAPQFGIRKTFASLGQACHSFTEKLNKRPAILTVSIVVVWFAIALVADRVVPGKAVHVTKGPNGSQQISLDANGFAQLALLAVMMLCSFGVFFRQRMSRYAVISGFAVFVAITIVFLPIVAADDSGKISKPLLFLLGEVGWAFMVGMYIGIGSLVAVLGGWFRMRRQRRELGRLSRHELLVRYFNIERRLQFASNDAIGRGPAPIVVSVQRWPMLWALGCSLILAIGSRLIVSRVPTSELEHPGNSSMLWLILSIIIAVIGMILWVLFAYLSGSPKRASLTSLCWSLGGIVNIFFNRQLASVKVSGVELAGGWIIAVLINMGLAAMIGIGALVQREAQREKALANNDPATLLAELLRFQYALSEGQTQVCVLVVDAAKSAAMKASADPLVVELSFRAYQAWIARVSHKHNGRVYTVTGDGAIVAFATCGEALFAAQDMQGDVERFNEEDNRLAAPFRLRIGLHSGEVAAGIDKVEFTEVIDIAAHVEAAAPVGGIAVTDTVIEQLSGYHFEPHLEDLDGHRVLLARTRAEE